MLVVSGPPSSLIRRHVETLDHKESVFISITFIFDHKSFEQLSLSKDSLLRRSFFPKGHGTKSNTDFSGLIFMRTEYGVCSL